MARGCPYSAASLATSTERLFVLLRKGSALLTEETAFQAIQGDLGDHLIIHASCNYMQMQLVFFFTVENKMEIQSCLFFHLSTLQLSLFHPQENHLP